MCAQRQASSSKVVKRAGATGMTIGALSVLACELPIVLALAGFAGIGGLGELSSDP
ncbi:MAG: hypothetical protein AB8B86_11610 [Pseudomonadales bacterium]